MRSNRSVGDGRFVWLEGVVPPAPERVAHVGVEASPAGYDATLGAVRGALRRGQWEAAEALLMRAGPLGGDDAAYLNLLGVMWEVRGDRRAARRFYGLAIRCDGKYEPAQQNMRRLYELDTFGNTRQPVALGDT